MAQFYDVTILDISCNKSNDVKGRVVKTADVSAS